ncbi:MAG: NosD domain-containing protein [Candidatus Hodarchaeales archaeon]|jgi:parallel beta-helix repeat protein
MSENLANRFRIMTIVLILVFGVFNSIYLVGLDKNHFEEPRVANKPYPRLMDRDPPPIIPAKTPFMHSNYSVEILNPRNITAEGQASLSSSMYQPSSIDPLVFTVSSSITPTGKYTHQENDSDGDSLINQLVFITEISVTDSNPYYFEMEVWSPDGEFRESVGVDVDLTPGIFNISLPIEMYSANRDQLSSSFYIRSLTIGYTRWNEINTTYPSYSTRIYNFTEFDPSPVFLTGNYFDEGVDTGGDGLFDYLALIIEVNVTVGGTYQFYLAMEESLWRTLDGQNLVPVVSSLSPGIYNISFRFDLIEVYVNQWNSAFLFYNILILSEDWTRVFEDAYNVYTTRIYYYTELDPWIILTSDYSDHGFDTDNDSFFNAIELQLGVITSVANEYIISIAYTSSLDDYSWSYTSIQNISTGVQNISVLISVKNTQVQYSDYFNSSYVIESISIQKANRYRDDTIILQASNVHTTRIYYYHEFDPPEVILTGFYGDKCHDTDDDEFYDQLEIIVEIQTFENISNYVCILELTYDLHSSPLSETVDLSLDVGTYNITLFFNTSPVGLFFSELDRLSIMFQIETSSIHNQLGETVDAQIFPFTTRIYRYFQFIDIGQEIILIDEDVAFLHYSHLRGWPGTGTADNPFIIKDLIMHGVSFTSSLIEIRNTTYFFTLLNLTLNQGETAIKLFNVTNVRVSQIYLSNMEIGFDINRCIGVTIDHCVLDVFESVVEISNSRGITVNFNTFHVHDKGLTTLGSQEIVIKTNYFISNNGWVGVRLINTHSGLLTNNTFQGFSFTGIYLQGGQGIIIDHNILSGNKIGITLGRYTLLLSPPSNMNKILNNIVCNNKEYGIKCEQASENNDIEKNDFLGNNIGGTSQVVDEGRSNHFYMNFWNATLPYLIDGRTQNYETSSALTPHHLSPPTLITPAGGANLKDKVVITWLEANDSFNHDLDYFLFYSPDNGTSWFNLSSPFDPIVTWRGMKGFRYEWNLNTSLHSPGSHYLIRVIVVDSLGFTNSITLDSPFIVENTGKNNSSLFSRQNIAGIIIFGLVGLGLIILNRKKLF